ncbi:hypothetical protein [Ruminococcus sp.]
MAANQLNAVYENLSSMFANYTENHIIGKRILARNNCILYAISEKNIISIKDGKVGKYTGTDALFYQDNGMHLQIFPNLSSQASELPDMIRQGRTMKNVNPKNQIGLIQDTFCIKKIADLLCCQKSSVGDTRNLCRVQISHTAICTF